MHEQQFVWTAVGEEIFQRESHSVASPVRDHAHFEVADFGITKHVGQCLGVLPRSPKLAKLRITVRVGSDDQGAAASCHLTHRLLESVPLHEKLDELLLLGDAAHFEGITGDLELDRAGRLRVQKRLDDTDEHS
jgi:hypothetical protein